jgi:hypothetical protein
MDLVYVLTNPAMPGFVKIGMTSMAEVSIRLAQLYTTGVPFPFELAFACKVPNGMVVETALHKAFAPYRPNSKREFFNIDPEQAIAILKLLHVDDATKEIEAIANPISDEEVQAGKQFKKRRPNMNFHEMGITEGSQLHFTDAEQTISVVGPRKVEWNGEACSLTEVTRNLLALPYSVSPGSYWTFEGKLLSTIYNETYLLDE